jgi:hypothetical protein
VPDYDHDTHAAGGGGSGGMLNQEFYEDVARAIGERIRDCGRRVPVVTGEYIACSAFLRTITTFSLPPCPTIFPLAFVMDPELN